MADRKQSGDRLLASHGVAPYAPLSIDQALFANALHGDPKTREHAVLCVEKGIYA